MLFVGLLSSYSKEWKIAPYRKIYCENLVEGINNIDNLSGDDFAPYQSDEQYVRKGVEIMKKYKLGIYR